MSYLGLAVEEHKTSTSPQKIEAFEQLIQAKLPDEYKQFLLKYNGGRPVSHDCFTVIEYIEGSQDTGSAGGIEWFLALYDGKHNNLEKHYTTIDKGSIPSDMITIARAFSNNMICLCVRGENYGKIYYWCFAGKAQDGDGSSYYDNVTLIANSFIEFINSLYEYKEDDE